MNAEINYANESYASVDTVAEIVSAWTKEAGTMLPKNPDDIKSLIVNGVTHQEWYLGREPILVGFGAITFNWPGNWKEIGCVVVKKEFRQYGVGHMVVKELITKAQSIFPDANLFALCNEKSLKLFLDNGAEVITNPDILPKEVFGECIHCPKFVEAKSQGKLCCDIPVMIKKQVSEPVGCYR